MLEENPSIEKDEFEDLRVLWVSDSLKLSSTVSGTEDAQDRIDVERCLSRDGVDGIEADIMDLFAGKFRWWLGVEWAEGVR